MRAMVLDAPRAELRWTTEAPEPVPGEGELLLSVEACGVCRTDLHIVDGDLAPHRSPLVLGHEIVGRIVATGPGPVAPRIGERVGVPWLGGTCQSCRFCREGRENLCDRARFTGYDLDGGYAERAVVDARYALPLPEGVSDVEAAPLLCAGVVGYRALKMAGRGRRLGLYGFGAAAHLAAQVARARGQEVYAFVRPGDENGKEFARRLGAVWAGDSTAPAPVPLDSAIVYAPVGELVPLALRAVDKGGKVVLAGIHMSDIPGFPYRDLWEERTLGSVANLTRQDGREFLTIADALHLRPTVTPFPLADANLAHRRLRRGELEGAAVLVPR